MTDRHALDHRLERLIFFSDAVFAIAITLLVIELRLPDLHGAGDAEWYAALAHLAPHLAAFALSFGVIGAFWASHHTMLSLVTGFDDRLIWANLLQLLFIALVPFTTAMLATGSLSAVPFAIYSGVLLAASLFKARLTTLAVRPALIAPSISATRMAVERRRRWILPIATGASLLLAFVMPGWNNLAMLLLPALRRLGPFRLPPDA